MDTKAKNLRLGSVVYPAKHVDQKTVIGISFDIPKVNVQIFYDDGTTMLVPKDHVLFEFEQERKV